MNTQISPIQLILPIAVFIGLAMAAAMGIWIADEKYSQLIMISAGVAVVGWAIMGRKIWWLPIFFFGSLGGHFFLGFKIYAHEIAVLLCLVPLAFAFAMQGSSMFNRKILLPTPVILLFIYLCFHFLGCVVYNKIEGLGGLGNVSRRYMDALWPFLVFIPFLFVGDTKYVKLAFNLMTLALAIRFSLGLYSAYFGDDQILFIPIVNFVPAGGFGGDLRLSGSMLTTALVCQFCMHRSRILRLCLLPLIGIGIWGTFLGGGRIIIVLLIGLFGFLAVVYKRVGFILVWIVVMILGVFFVNSEPEMLNKAPDTVKRAATAFMFDRDVAAETGETAASDLFHQRLREEGWKSWTKDGFTILFGRGVFPFDEQVWGGADNLENMVLMATVTSRFEKGLWDTLCTFGIIGLVLYSMLLFMIVRDCLPILLRDGVASPTHAMMFIATYYCGTWFAICWLSGSFPSREIFFGMIALVAADDMIKQRKLEAEREAMLNPVSVPKTLTLPDNPVSADSPIAAFRRRQRLLTEKRSARSGRF